jgi:hypothetical protein
MTWRRFQVLLRCLSSASHTVTQLQSENYIGRRNEPVLVTGAANVDRAFEAAFKK